MKYIVLVPDGMADEPIPVFGGKTPLEFAVTNNMDHMARNGMCGLVQTIPAGMPPGSDVGNLALLGYNPKECFSGRSPLEAANMGIVLAEDEIAFRCNLVNVHDGVMVDYSAGHIGTEEADKFIATLNKEIPWPGIKFYTGKSYRHLMVMKTNLVTALRSLKTTPPHDILNKTIQEHLPAGKYAEHVLKVMEWAREILTDHPVNQQRIERKEVPVNLIWLWGQGVKPQLPLFKDRFGVKGSIISAVDLVNGIGRLAGLNVIDVPGATGYYDTNYLGKAQYALDSLKNNDFVYVHVEAPDEAGHNGDAQAKAECIGRIDKDIVGTILNYFNAQDDVRILVVPDHPTPVAKRTHTNAAVPFVMYGKGISSGSKANAFSETWAAKNGLKFGSGEEMMTFFMKNPVGH